jgi:hypothetical protein
LAARGEKKNEIPAWKKDNADDDNYSGGAYCNLHHCQ